MMRTKAETRGASYIKYRLIGLRNPRWPDLLYLSAVTQIQDNSGVTRGQPHQHTDKVRISG